MVSSQKSVAVIGGGPAGLMAAEVAAAGGALVTVYEHKRSVGRKFLVAGKSGLNLTNAAEFSDFHAQYSGKEFPVERWQTMLAAFDNDALGEWALKLGVETFVASSGKVFPMSKKAAPLLRAWVLRLKASGVKFEVGHRWVGLRAVAHGVEIDFESREGEVTREHTAVILACGGATWPQTGSDGSWVSILEGLGVEITPLASANCGWECGWSEMTLAEADGKPLHHLEIRAGEVLEKGELLVTRYGLEGTPLYALGKVLRAMETPELVIDFKPTFTVERLVAKMESARRDFYKEAQLRWKLPVAACAIIRQLYGEMDTAEKLAKIVKACRIPLYGARPIEEAISTAGGVAWAELDECLMVKRLPSVYCAGEMLDWEAPTGGYLLQGSFATGNWAGKST